MNKQDKLQEAMIRMMLESSNKVADEEALKDEIWEYITDDSHRLEDFSDIEMDTEEAHDEAYEIATKKLMMMTSEELAKMKEEIDNRTIDLVAWGSAKWNYNESLNEDCTQVSNVDAGKIDSYPVNPKEMEKKRKIEKIVLNEDDNKWNKYLDVKIDIYDIHDFVKKECGDKYETYNYGSGAAIMFAPNGKGCIADYEAIGLILNSTSDEFNLSLIDKPTEIKNPDGSTSRSISVIPQYTAKVTAQEIMDTAAKTTKTIAEFFEKRNYNSRCISNFEQLMSYLIKIGFFGDNEEENLEEFLDPNITIAPSTSLDLGDGAGLGMLAGML